MLRLSHYFIELSSCIRPFKACRLRCKRLALEFSSEVVPAEAEGNARVVMESPFSLVGIVVIDKSGSASNEIRVISGLLNKKTQLLNQIFVKSSEKVFAYEKHSKRLVPRFNGACFQVLNYWKQHAENIPSSFGIWRFYLSLWKFL